MMRHNRRGIQSSAAKRANARSIIERGSFTVKVWRLRRRSM